LNDLQEAEPQQALVSVALAETYLRLHRIQDAAQAGYSAVKIDPASAFAHAALGWALIELNSPAEGLVCFERALRLGPEHSDFLAGRGIALSRLGHHFAAVECLEGVQGRDPEYCASNPKVIEYLTISRSMLKGASGADPRI
jgi:tetratricopeptide (TPR) repeat protein